MINFKRIYLLLTAVFFLNQITEAKKKHGLIIAIGEYSAATKWPSISSTKDVPLIKSLFENQGFNTISILQDSNATKQGIMDALDALKQKVNKGDIVFIHISSHGQQIQDYNGDELDDGLDECIAAYDAPAYYSPGYKGEKHLTDDEIQIYLNSLRGKLGKSGDVILTLDACHSGTAARGGKARGGVPALIDPSYVANTNGKTDNSLGEKEFQFNSNTMANLVVFSAAQAHELNYEYQGNGSLTLALSKAFENIKPNETYRSLFAKVASEMATTVPKQTPAIEGDIDRMLFDGATVVQEAYYTLGYKNATNININGSVLSGLFKDSEFNIYPSGTLVGSAAKPITTGRIIYSDNFMSQGVTKDLLEGKLEDYWLFITKKSFGELKVVLNLEMKKSKQKELENELSPLSFVIISSENSNYTLKLHENGSYGLYSTAGLELIKDNISKVELKTSLEEEFGKFMQSTFLSNLELKEDGISLQCELLPIVVEGNKIVDRKEQSFKEINGIPTFAKGDYALLKLINNGTVDVYFTILDLQPDGVINPVVPNPYKNEPAQSFFIRAGDTLILENKYLRFYPPYGIEKYKIFASVKPLNLAPLVMTKGANSRGPLTTKLEQLFKSTYTLSRGTPVETLEMDEGIGTFDLIFKITPIK